MEYESPHPVSLIIIPYFSLLPAFCRRSRNESVYFIFWIACLRSALASYARCLRRQRLAPGVGPRAAPGARCSHTLAGNKCKNVSQLRQNYFRFPCSTPHSLLFSQKARAGAGKRSSKLSKHSRPSSVGRGRQSFCRVIH